MSKLRGTKWWVAGHDAGDRTHLSMTQTERDAKALGRAQPPQSSGAGIQAAGAWCVALWRSLLRVPEVAAWARRDPEACRLALGAESIARLLTRRTEAAHPGHREACGEAGRIPNPWAQVPHLAGLVAEFPARRAAADLPPLPDLNATDIHHVHQRLLAYSIRPGDRDHGIVVGAGTRKRLGSYNTPPELAHPTAFRTLRPLRRCTGIPRILDAAAGGGALLTAAVDALATSDPHRRDLGRFGLFGIERDPVAAVLLRWAIVEHCGLKPEDWPQLGNHLHTGDALTGRPLLGTDSGEDPHGPGENDSGDSLHWDRAFPEARREGGFDAILGNPPWETLQVQTAELSETFGDAMSPAPQPDRIFKRAKVDSALARDWATRSERTRAAVHRLRNAAPALGYTHQGRGKLHTDRLFLERCWHALRPGGRLGMVLPSGIQTDRGTAPLRRMLWDTGRWLWWFQMENRAKWFPIDSRYRFGILISERFRRHGRAPAHPAVRFACAVEDANAWATPRPKTLRYPQAVAEGLSPACGALLDVQTAWELEILHRLHGDHPRLVGPGGVLGFRQGDYNMTRDAAHFTLVSEAERRGYRQGDDQVWRLPGAPDLLPLYQGAMVWELHPNAGWFAGGQGARSKWQAPADGGQKLRPRYLVHAEEFAARLERSGRTAGPRVVLRALSNATNQRTAVAGLLWGQPCGNSLAVLEPDQDLPGLTRTDACAWGAAVLGSLVFDWAWRRRMPGTNLNGYLLEEVGWPTPPSNLKHRAGRLAASLGWLLKAHGAAWTEIPRDPRAHRAEFRARRLALLDALVAKAAGIQPAELHRMLLPPAHSGGVNRGFGHLDHHLPENRRRPNRAVRALAALQ